MRQAELNDLQATNRFGVVPGQLEVKWFAEQLEHAVKWGEQFTKWDDIPHDFYVMIEVPDDLAAEFAVQGRRDGIGPARSATLEQLRGVTWTEVRP